MAIETIRGLETSSQWSDFGFEGERAALPDGIALRGEVMSGNCSGWQRDGLAGESQTDGVQGA